MKKAKFAIGPQSVAHRAGKQQSSAERKNETKTEDKKSDKKQEKTQANYSNPYKTETSYKTGYAGTESKFERAKIKHKARKAARKAKATRTSNINPKGFFGELGRYIVRFIKSPIEHNFQSATSRKSGNNDYCGTSRRCIVAVYVLYIKRRRSRTA